jgi:hypothetical protein
MSDSMRIANGGNIERYAKVDASGRLETQTVTLTEQELSSEVGRSFNVFSDDVTLTTANESGVLYYKHGEDLDAIVTGIIYNFGSSTGGSGECKIKVFRNPTAGTLISTASAGSKANRDFRSSELLSGSTVYKGTGAALTVTDGDVILPSRFGAPARVFIGTGNFRLTRNNSIAVTVTPPSGNTSMIVQAAFAIHLTEGNIGV